MTYEFSVADNIAVGDITAPGDRPATRPPRAGRASTDADGPSHGYDTMLSRTFTTRGRRTRPASSCPAGSGSGSRSPARCCARRAICYPGRAVVGPRRARPSTSAPPAAELRQGRTALLISHRLNTVRDADLIVVLEAGAVVEQGDHDELMAAGGAYAEMFRLQASGFAEVVP